MRRTTPGAQALRPADRAALVRALAAVLVADVRDPEPVKPSGDTVRVIVGRLHPRADTSPTDAPVPRAQQGGTG